MGGIHVITPNVFGKHGCFLQNVAIFSTMSASKSLHIASIHHADGSITIQILDAPSIMTRLKMGKTKQPIFYSRSYMLSKLCYI